MISWINNNPVVFMLIGFNAIVIVAWLNMRNFRKCVQADNSHLDELQYEINNFMKSVNKREMKRGDGK